MAYLNTPAKPEFRTQDLHLIRQLLHPLYSAAPKSPWQQLDAQHYRHNGSQFQSSGKKPVMVKIPA